MTDSPRIYHNPRCSKSRATLNLLRERGLEPEVVEYLNTPPDETTLREILDQLGIGPRELMRTGETEYRELGLDDPGVSDEQLLRAMVEHPKLMERPIVLHAGKARLGRPPERVLEILQ